MIVDGWNGDLEAALTGFQQAVGDKARERFPHGRPRNRHGLRERGIAKTLAHWKCATTQLLSAGSRRSARREAAPSDGLENQFAHTVISEAVRLERLAKSVDRRQNTV